MYLESSEIRIYYVCSDDSSNDATRLYPISIEKDGDLNLSNVPAEFDEFFINDIDDTIAIARARIQYNSPTEEDDEPGN